MSTMKIGLCLRSFKALSTAPLPRIGNWLAVEPEVGELDDVYLYTVDDLHEVVAENLKSRQGAAQAAEELVSIGADDFMNTSAPQC